VRFLRISELSLPLSRRDLETASLFKIFREVPQLIFQYREFRDRRCRRRR
jgi:hypothetical protein